MLSIPAYSKRLKAQVSFSSPEKQADLFENIFSGTVARMLPLTSWEGCTSDNDHCNIWRSDMTENQAQTIAEIFNAKVGCPHWDVYLVVIERQDM